VVEFSKHAPIERLKCHGRPWEGLLSMEKLVAELHTLLPASFSDLQQGERWRQGRARALSKRSREIIVAARRQGCLLVVHA
jgi:hypothetical protein